MADYNIQRGMSIFDPNGQNIGTVEDITDRYFVAGGQHYPLDSGYRLDNNGIYLTGSANEQYTDATTADQNELRVPVVEEQLNVGKRQVELGEVELHKTVTQEQVNVPVELRREEVNVQQVDVPNRPLQPGETAFQEGTIRVPVRGEEAVVNKQAVVTGEVAINKNVTTDQQTVSDTVRKEQVIVDKNVDQARDQVVTQTTAQTAPTNAQPDGYDTGAPASVPANYSQGQIQPDMPVYSSDGAHLGKVKELREDNFVVSRGLFKGDIEVDYSAIGQAITMEFH